MVVNYHEPGGITVMSSRDLISPDEVAEILGVATQTLAIWRCARRYGLPFVRVGRLIRYRKADVEAWLTARTQKGDERHDGEKRRK